MLFMVLCTIKNHRRHSIRVGHSPGFGLHSVAIFPAWLFRKGRKTIFPHSQLADVARDQRCGDIHNYIVDVMNSYEDETTVMYILVCVMRKELSIYIATIASVMRTHLPHIYIVTVMRNLHLHIATIVTSCRHIRIATVMSSMLSTYTYSYCYDQLSTYTYIYCYDQLSTFTYS